MKLLYLTWNHRLSQRGEKEKKKMLNLNDQVIIIVMSIREEEKKATGKQLTLHRVYTTNDCFGRRPSVRSSLALLCALHSY